MLYIKPKKKNELLEENGYAILNNDILSDNNGDYYLARYGNFPGILNLCKINMKCQITFKG